VSSFLLGVVEWPLGCGAGLGTLGAHDVVDGLVFGWSADGAPGSFVGFVLFVREYVVFAAVVEAET
jgi:hypothetical protein